MHLKLIPETIQHSRVLSAHVDIVHLSENSPKCDSTLIEIVNPLSRIEVQQINEETLPSSRARDQVPLLQKTRESHVNNSNVME